MQHTSIPMETPCEFINITPLNPLISKCQIKVCYVGDTPNRNRSVITKDVARQMANSLPGSPIVGYFNDGKQDFEEHNRSIKVSNGRFEIEDTTRPYGFVDLNAKCWFQKYTDDDTVVREYLVTEGYLWTGQYPECQRVVEKGNNQSMELDEDTLDATWTKDDNGKPKFFIINEAIVSKLCVLGEDCEPCFEGSNITPVQFSLDDNFKEELRTMMKELKEYLLASEGGTQVFTKYAVEIGDSLWSALYSYIEKAFPDMADGYCSRYSIEGIYEESGQKFAVLKSRNDLKYYKLLFSISDADGFAPGDTLVEVTKSYTPSAEPQFALADVEKFESEYKCGGGAGSSDDKKKKKDFKKDKDGKSDSSKNEDTTEDGKSSEEDKKDKPEDGDTSKKEDDSDKEKAPVKEDEDPEKDKKDEDKKKKSKYSLEEIPEYVELVSKFSDLESKYSALVEERDSLQSQLEPLIAFKNESEKKEKEEMINSFCMLSDEDKKEVVENIDTYSLDDIEAKLSIICVRNKVSFNLDDDSEKKDPTVYNLHGDESLNDSATPAWVKAALDVAKTL